MIANRHSAAEESKQDRSFFCLLRSLPRDVNGPYDGFWLSDGARATTASFVVERVLAETPDWVAERFPLVTTFNLERWKSSGTPEEWVSAHLKGWTREDFLAVLASLRKSSFWPMDECAIGQHLDALRARIVEEKLRYLLLAEEPVVYPDDYKNADRDEPAFCASNFREAARSFGLMQHEAKARLDRATNFARTALFSMVGLSPGDLANVAQNARSRTVREQAITWMGVISRESSGEAVGGNLTGERH